MPLNLIKSVLIVVFFWWVVLSIWHIWAKEIEIGKMINSSFPIFVLSSLGVLIGFFAAWSYIWLGKRALRESLVGENVRGLTCTIGELPLVAKEPRRAEELPDLALYTDIPANFLTEWFEEHKEKYPAHCNLATALLQIYEFNKDLPATHIEGGHGGRTLLHHSLLAAFYMAKLSKTWKYTGLRDRSGKRVVLKLRDPMYQFNPEDPLIFLIGLAHDIGKIEAYIFEDGTREIIGIHHEHDLTGARMLARLPESWEIPDEDRLAIFLAIAHYHHPMELPLSPDRRAINDRTIALMELLIKADFVTSRVEAKGAEPTDAEYENTDNIDVSLDTTPERIWEVFSEVIVEFGRINSPDPKFNVATLCDGQDFGKPLLIIKESAIRSVLMARLKIPDALMLGDGRYQLTIDLLKVLDGKEILLKQHGGHNFTAENALWNVDFLTRGAAGAKPQKRSGWSAVLIIDPKLFPRIEKMEPYWWYAVIARGTMGAARSIHKKKAQASGSVVADDFDAQLNNAMSSLVGAEQAEEQGEVVAAPSMPAEAAPGAAPVVTEAVSVQSADEEDAFALLDDLLSPAVAAPAAPAAPVLAVPTPVPAVAAPAAPATAVPAVPAPEHEPTSPDLVISAAGVRKDVGKDIAPLDVTVALKDLLVAAKDQNIELKRLNARYLVSLKTLQLLAPRVEWAQCRYKIDQMIKGARLTVVLIPMGPPEANDYALAFKVEDL